MLREDIPDDVWIAARNAAAGWYRDSPATMERMLMGGCDSWPVVAIAAEAINVERGRTLSIARSLRGPNAELIAEQIESGVQKSKHQQMEFS